MKHANLLAGLSLASPHPLPILFVKFHPNFNDGEQDMRTGQSATLTALSGNLTGDGTTRLEQHNPASCRKAYASYIFPLCSIRLALALT